MKASAPNLGRGVIVLGMHRSGTSAVTGVIDGLGVPAAREEDRFPIRRWNSRGNYESRSVSLFDDQLLERLGGRWWAPPVLPRGWALDPQVQDLLPEARRIFSAAYPTPTWVWKDPRACVLLPFWDRVLGRDIPRILVLRSPLESAASLHRRDGLPIELALALAERSLRDALRDSAGRPVLITSYTDVMSDGVAWCRRTTAFLNSHGVPVPKPLRIREALAFVDEALRHHSDARDLEGVVGVTSGLGRLWSWTCKRQGAHDALSIRDLPPASHEMQSTLRTWLEMSVAAPAD